MKYRLRTFPLILSLLFYFILLLSEKEYFIAKIFNMHIVFIGLTCMQMYAEMYLEPIETSMAELLWKNHKKALL